MHQRNKIIPVTINNPAVPQHYIYLTTEAQVVASVAINMHHKIVLMLQVFKPERKYSERQEDVLCASEKSSEKRVQFKRQMFKMFSEASHFIM